MHEVGACGKLLEDYNFRVVEVHVSGGVPSRAPLLFYKKLLDEPSTYFDAEASLAIGANPEDFKNRGLVEEFYSSGVREVGMGVQSFNIEV